MQHTDRRKNRLIPITAATERALASITRATGFTAGDIINAVVPGVADHVREKRELTFPLRILARGEAGCRACPSAPSTSPQVRPAHAKKLTRVAALLNLAPQDFLDWHLGPLLDDLLNPRTGELRHWAEKHLEYSDIREQALVVTRVGKWSERASRRLERRRKRALARRKPSTETEVAA